MKLSLIILLCATLTLSASARSLLSFGEVNLIKQSVNQTVPDVLSSMISMFKSEFTNYKKEHNKIYKSIQEEDERFFHFMSSFIKVNDHNALYDQGKKSYKMAINHMSDWSSEEQNRLNGFKLSNTAGSMYLSPSVNLDLPDFVDWREKGAVTDVKDQNNCGSCYSFSSTGSLEGQIWKKTGKLISLSEQQIIDCDHVDNGCHGGFMGDALTYIKNAGGIEREKDYPYVSGETDQPNDKCYFNKERVVATDSGFVQLPKGDEEKLKEAVATIGPISIAFSASQNFHAYSTGIFHDDECANMDLNHAVLVVGYGTDEATQTPYWIIKNSWNPTWGENGYFRMRRNINLCNMANYSIYPLI